MAKLSQLFGGSSTGFPYLPQPPERVATSTRYANFADDTGSTNAATSPLVRMRSIDVSSVVPDCNLNIFGTPYTLQTTTPSSPNIASAVTASGTVTLFNRMTKTTVWSATYSSISQAVAGNTLYVYYQGGAYIDKTGGLLYLPLVQASNGAVIIAKIVISTGVVSGVAAGGFTVSAISPATPTGTPQTIFGSKLVSTVFQEQPNKLYIFQSMNPTKNATTFNTLRINLSTGTGEGTKSVSLYSPVGDDWVSCKYAAYDRSVIITDCSTAALTSDYFEFTIVRGSGSIRFRVPKEFPIPFDVSKVVYAANGTPNYAESSFILYDPAVLRITCNLFSDNVPQGAQGSYSRTDWDRWLNEVADYYGMPPAATIALPA